MVDEVIKALATVVIKGLSLSYRAANFTLKDTSQAPASIKSVVFSSTLPNASVPGYNITEVTESDLDGSVVYLTVVGVNIAAGYSMNIKATDASTATDDNFDNFKMDDTYTITMVNGLNGETIGWRAITLASVVAAVSNKVDLIWSSGYEGSETSWMVYGLYTNDIRDGWISTTQLQLPNGATCTLDEFVGSTRVKGSTVVWIALSNMVGTVPSSLTIDIPSIGSKVLSMDNLNTNSLRKVYHASWPEAFARVRLAGQEDSIIITAVT